MLLKCEPLDTLFFRNGKPFAMGEDNWSESVFPPYPSVFYGSLRTVFFAENVQAFSHAGTDNDPTSSLRIRSVVLKAWNDYYFPIPQDLVKAKGEKENRAFLLRLQDTSSLSNCTLPKTLGAPDLVVEAIADGLVDQASLQEYLDGANELYYTELSDFVIQEPKIGIALNDLRIAEDHKLYRSAMLRLLPECAFVVDCEGIALPENGFMKLGGEGKGTYFHCIDESFVPPPPAVDSQFFKVYLMTPAVLSNGWLPSWIDPESFIGCYEGLKVRVLSAALGRYISVGGFDVNKGRPKPMVRAVPAGSVYYFELLEGERERLGEVFHYKPLEENKYAKEGFGTVLVGKVNV